MSDASKSRIEPLPRHLAVIMDGNGRWAQRRRRPRSFGHQAGVKSVREVVRGCGEHGVKALTLFAFSGENWARPQAEVQRLMELFTRALRKESAELHEKNVAVRFIGDLARFSPDLQQLMHNTMAQTAANTGMILSIAVNYSGQWDIAQATRALAVKVAAGELDPSLIDESLIERHCCLADLPAPDLMIRTGGEVRISNFLLWQMAYTELYFCDVLWPDFGVDELNQALADFARRERRFGRTSDQVAGAINA